MAEIIIIGGGVSGLSAGIYAQLYGHSAVICEKHNIAGGNLTGWRRGGFVIDNCIHWLTGTNPVTKTYRMWEELGALGGVDVLQGESLYTCEFNGQTLSLHRDLQKIKQEMLEISPSDEKEIKSFIRAVEAVQALSGIAGDRHSGGLTPRRLVYGIPALLRCYGVTTDGLAARFSHPLLRSFIRAFFGGEFGALALVTVFAVFCGENGGVPAGGSPAMSERMTERFKSLGGRLLLEKEAEKINRTGNRAVSVSFTDGTVLKADYIMLTTDPDAAFGRLLDLPMPKQLKKLYSDPKMKRFSSCQCAFSLNMSEPPFRGGYILEVPEEYRTVLRAKQIIVREFSHEPDFSPEGENILQTIAFCYENDAKNFIRLRDGDKESYSQKKRGLADAVQKLLTAKFPQLDGKLKCLDVWTPATYRRYTGSKTGSYMSFALPASTLPHRISNRIVGISNVILATQWLESPGGLPIAAEGGRKAVETVLALEKRAKNAKRKRARIFRAESEAAAETV